ncbi:MAG: ATP-binding protein [Xanthomonadales bacterium]|nr:ATP-binding protein [Xanthomonadales bacterium]
MRREQRERRSTSTATQPRRLIEDARREWEVLAGGYSRRQLLELLQNAFDAVGAGDREEGRVAVRIAGERLYVANDGRPFDRAGYGSLLASDLSAKRGEEIGRFGLGFKSLIRIGREIDVFSEPAGGLRFAPARCRRELWRLWTIADGPAAESGSPPFTPRSEADCPAMRLAWPLDPERRVPGRSDSRGAPSVGRPRWCGCGSPIRSGIAPSSSRSGGGFLQETLLFVRCPVSAGVSGG